MDTPWGHRTTLQHTLKMSGPQWDCAAHSWCFESVAGRNVCIWDKGWLSTADPTRGPTDKAESTGGRGFQECRTSRQPQSLLVKAEKQNMQKERFGDWERASIISRLQIVMWLLKSVSAQHFDNVYKGSASSVLSFSCQQVKGAAFSLKCDNFPAKEPIKIPPFIDRRNRTQQSAQ